jgi:hypothetical protein
MLVAVSGRVTEVREAQPSKADSAIVVTVKVELLYSTVSGTITSPLKLVDTAGLLSIPTPTCTVPVPAALSSVSTL